MFPHLQPIKPIVHNYGKDEMTLEKANFSAIKQLKYFQGEHQNTPATVRMPIGRVLSGPLPSPSFVRANTPRYNSEEIVGARIVWDG